MAIAVLPNQEFGRRQIRDLVCGVPVRDTAWQARIAATVARWGLATVDAATFGKFNNPAGDSQCSITATDKTLTSINAVWTAADVGKSIHVQGAGVAGATLSTTIASYTSAGEIELTDAASTTVAQSYTSTAGLAVWGDDPNIDFPTVAQPEIDSAGAVVRRKGNGPLGNVSASLVLATGGTTARTLADHFGDVLNVKNFGARGDGATLDTAAVVAAAAALADGDALFFPPGEYLLDHDGASDIGDFGKAVISLTGKLNIRVVGQWATIKVVDHDITANGGLLFLYATEVKGLEVCGLSFDMTFTGRNNSALLYPFCGAVVVNDEADGAKTQDELSSDIHVHDCEFKLFHPYGQYVTTGNPYNGDPNNGYKLFSIFISGDYLGSTYASQNRGATIERCLWRDGHNGYGAWVWAYNRVAFRQLGAEAWVGKRSTIAGAVAGTGVAFIRYHQFLCSGVEVSGCKFRAKPSSERGTAGFQGAAVFCYLDTNQTGDHAHGEGRVFGNDIHLSNGDAANNLTDYGVMVSTYGSTVIETNNFDGDADATNAFDATGIYLGYEPVGGDGKASVIIKGNTWGWNCSYQNNIRIANGSAVAAYNRRLKSLVVQGNISNSQGQYFLDMTSNSAVAYLGVAHSIIDDNVVIGTYNTLWDSGSTNSRAFQLAASEAGDVLVISGNTVKDKNRFSQIASINAGAVVVARDNNLIGVTTEASGGTLALTRQTSGTAAPTAGYHSRGELVWRSDATASQSPGWICTAAGTPGTWKTLPAVSA